MAYDEKLAARVLDHFEPRSNLTTRKMFGGLCVMLGGHMCCGIVGESLMLRLGPAGTVAALAEAHVREMDFTGRPMAGMVYVDAPALGSDRQLGAWLDRAATFVAGLPPKSSPKG